LKAFRGKRIFKKIGGRETDRQFVLETVTLKVANLLCFCQRPVEKFQGTGYISFLTRLEASRK